MSLPIYFIFLFIFITLAFIYDITKGIIPNWLNVIFALIGVVTHTLMSGLNGFVQSFGGGLICLIIMLILYVIKAIGAGDVKLFFAIGCLSGILFSLYAIMYSVIFAGIFGIIYLLFTRTFLIQMSLAALHMKESIQKNSLSSMEDFKNKVGNRFPFMVAVLPGVIVTFYYMHIV